MPIPLIAAALIAAGAAGGSGGLALGGKGALDIKKANDRIKKATRRHDAKRAKTEKKITETNKVLGGLGEDQQVALEAVVVRMGDFLRRNAKKVRESERLLVDGIDVTVSKVTGAGGLDPDAQAWVRGVIGSAVTGAGVSSGITTAVGTWGVASTGTAISGLSGAAATSSTMAFLGGGSLASGGGGVALGATALNFVTIGPAVLVGGLVIKGQGTKARTKAKEWETKVDVEVAKLSETRARLRAVDQRVEELSDVLTRLVDRGVVALDVLESEDFDPDAHAERFQHALAWTMAVRDVTATPVLDGSGELNDKTGDLVVRYRSMTEGSSDE